MTLAPVFRSANAVAMLGEYGIWERLAPSLARQMEAVRQIREDLAYVIGEPFRTDPKIPISPDGSTRESSDDLSFLQDFFFLTLFLSLFESLGIDPKRLPFYAQLDFCIMGTITAADNLFDDQSKILLPLRPSKGTRYQAILQLMCFERLMRRCGDRAIEEKLFDLTAFSGAQQALIDQMAEIGLLEGSEEGGVDEIPSPETMIEHVHKVRGGMLFGLAFAAPSKLETGALYDKLIQAKVAIAQLGTAFQIVDDLTDFEFDIKQRTHNLLVSWIWHHGTSSEREKLDTLWSASIEKGTIAESGLVESTFANAAHNVLECARIEGRKAFETLANLGFWFPPTLADEVIHAIVGLDGVARMEFINKSSKSL